jgi:hypothetical protein
VPQFPPLYFGCRVLAHFGELRGSGEMKVVMESLRVLAQEFPRWAGRLEDGQNGVCCPQRAHSLLHGLANNSV